MIQPTLFGDLFLLVLCLAVVHLAHRIKKLGSKNAWGQSAALTKPAPTSYTPRMDKSAPVKEGDMKTYILPVEVEQEADGRWSAVVSALPGCAVWGYSKEEALRAIKEAAQAYIETLIEQGKAVPAAKDIELKETPVVSVTV